VRNRRSLVVDAEGGGRGWMGRVQNAVLVSTGLSPCGIPLRGEVRGAHISRMRLEDRRGGGNCLAHDLSGCPDGIRGVFASDWGSGAGREGVCSLIKVAERL